MSKCHCEHGVKWFRPCLRCDPEITLLDFDQMTVGQHEAMFSRERPWTVEQMRAHLWRGALLASQAARFASCDDPVWVGGFLRER